MPSSTVADIDWGEIKRKYEHIRARLEGLRLVGPSEFKALRLHALTYGQIPAPGWRKIEYGQGVYVHPSTGSLNLEAWIGLALEIGAPVADELKLPTRVMTMLGSKSNPLKVLEETIRNRSLSQAFIDAWGRLHALHQRFVFLSLSRDASGEMVSNALEGLKQGIDVQKRWYAHWISSNVSPAKDRDTASQELGHLCADIRDGKVKPYGPYPREWFELLLGKPKKEEKKERFVGSNFRKISERRLAQLVLDPVFTIDLLPPLSRDEFRKTGGPSTG
jgi:hypothetical protein